MSSLDDLAHAGTTTADRSDRAAELRTTTTAMRECAGQPCAGADGKADNVDLRIADTPMTPMLQCSW